MSTLILLVGGNPLPNYVVARYLLSQGHLSSNILLIHSSSNDRIQGTAEVAKRLRLSIQALEKEGWKGEVILCPVKDTANSYELEGLLHSEITRLERASRQPEEIHLNYTGGRKTMAVYTYRAVQQLKKNGRKVEISYLDQDWFKLRYDDERGREEPRAGDLRDLVKLSLEELIELHNCERVDKPEDLSAYLPLAEAIYALAAEPLINKGKDNQYKTYLSLINNNSKIPVATPGPSIAQIESLTTALFFLGSEFSWDKIDTLNKISQKFLRGGWLEQVVFNHLSKQKGDEKFLKPFVPITECFPNVEAIYGGSSDRMELDVVLLRGYELIVVSCTTMGYGTSKADKNEKGRREIKLKAFEVWQRARQLGGEEARAIVVTLAGRDVVEGIRQDLRNDFLGNDFKLYLLGQEDLSNLEGAFKRILKP
ncbi:MAG: DUF1887 family CARF protein [Chloroflexota bacterium]|nr:DUF1887 family protein [Chloroflexota bacterium]